MSVCTYVRTYVCMYACMHVYSMYVCMYACMHVYSMYVCMQYVCMYVYMHVCSMCVYLCRQIGMHVYYICTYVCMYSERTYLQPPEVYGEYSEEEDHLQEGITEQAHQSNDAKLLQHVVEEDDTHAGHDDQCEQVAGDSPALLAQAHSNPILDLKYTQATLTGGFCI